MNTLRLLNDLYKASKTMNPEEVLRLSTLLTEQGTSYRLQNKVLQLANVSNCIDDSLNTIECFIHEENNLQQATA